MGEEGVTLTANAAHRGPYRTSQPVPLSNHHVV